MRFADFCEEFATVEVSEYSPGYVSTLCPLTPGDSCQVACMLDVPAAEQKEVEVVISVLQESDEAFTRNKRKKFSAARVELLEFTSPDSPSRSTRGARHVASSSFAMQRETLLRVAVKPGVGYVAIVHWLQALPPQSWNRQCILRVYAPCRVQLRQWSDVAMVAVSRREAYEAAAMGPRGVCLKDQGGVRLRCWSDRDSGTIALVFDATTAEPGGLLASIHWRLQNAHLQPSFPSDDNIKAKDVQEHVQHVELKPGQRQLTLVSWLDPVMAFSASYSWQAATDPCAECGSPVGTPLPGRFSGAYRKLERAAVHEECYANYVMRTASRCLSCSKPIAHMNGYGGQFFELTEGQLGNHAAGRVHLECRDEFQLRFAQCCIHCKKPIVQMNGFSGRHFTYKDGHFGPHGEGSVHEECQDAFLHQWAPKCLHCKEPLLKSSRFSGRIFDYGGAGAKQKQAVHEECNSETTATSMDSKADTSRDAQIKQRLETARVLRKAVQKQFQARPKATVKDWAGSGVRETLRKKVSETESLLRQLHVRMEGTETSARKVNQSICILEREQHSLEEPAIICERRLLVRDQRPLDEQVEDDLQVALLNERFVLEQAYKMLSAYIDAGQELREALQAAKCELVADLQFKRHALRLEKSALQFDPYHGRDRACVLPLVPDGQSQK
eukprot:symbB.v1.2.024368.t2/scaffold2250.1/size119560/2